MKYVKYISVLLLAGMLVACAGNKPKIPLSGQKVELKQTHVYLPKQSYDENGKAIAYEISENPYLQEKSKINKGSVLLFIEAKKAIRNKNYAKAKQKLMVVTQKDKTLSGPWVLLGNVAVEEKQYKQAQSHYQEAIKINSDNINAYIALAKLQRIMGEFHVAQNTLSLVLSIWKDCPEAHLNLGILYDLYLNQPKKAQQHIEAYLFLDGYKNKQAIAWFQEIKSRTGIEKSFIDSKQSTNHRSLMGSVEG